MHRIVHTAVAAALLASSVVAQNATVSVLHGIPNLPQPVEVFANGTSLFTFDFGELEGPLSVPAGVTNLEVRLNGTTILQASPDLQADENYTVVAHLLEGGGNQLTAFVNDLSRIEGLGEFFATIAFRHVADAPAVDVFGDRFSLGREVQFYSNVSNGNEGLGYQDAPAYLLSGTYDIRLTPTGSPQTAFGPDPIGNTVSGDFYSVFAIGELGQPSFRLVTQRIEGPAPTLPALQTFVRGTSCGGQISLSTTTPQFDQDFDVLLTGATPSATGVLMIGLSDSNFFGFTLPLPLNFLTATGCMLYQDTSVGVLAIDVDAAGNASVTQSIPAAFASLIARDGVHFQYAYLTSAGDPLSVVFTDYASIEEL
jgi:hypothetical protein